MNWLNKSSKQLEYILPALKDRLLAKSLQSDGFVGYVSLDEDLVDIEHIYCLAHVRAKLVVAYNIGKVKEAHSLSFASEDGIECSAAYHTIVQTCRMMRVRVLKYLQSFFKTFKDGCRDFMNMLPGKLAID